jgi:ribosomal protein S18 acetylase RimI-like enzyme
MPQIREFISADYDEAMALWSQTEGLTLREVDSREAIARYLDRNPGLSFVARDEGHLVGAVLAGTDGRRGYLQHLAVARSHRGRGLGRDLADRSVQALWSLGIRKCHIMVREENVQARAFWMHLGWDERGDVMVMSHTDPSAANA